MFVDCRTMRQVSMGNPDITSRYFKDLRRLKVLGSEEQTELIQEYAKSNDDKRKTEIMQKLVLSNQPFIVSMARHLSTENDFNDLISEGNLGLIRAIDAFNPEKENKFLTYAAYHVKKAMNDYISNVKRIVKPRNVARVYAYSEGTKNKFFVENGRYPSIDELVDELEDKGVTFSNKEDLYNISVSSIDSGFDGDCSDTTDETWFDKYCYTRTEGEYGVSNVSTHIEKMSVHQMVQQSLSYLDDEEKKLMCQYFGIGCKQQTPYEISLKNGMNPKNGKRVIEGKINKCIKKIRKNGKIQTDVQ